MPATGKIDDRSAGRSEYASGHCDISPLVGNVDRVCTARRPDGFSLLELIAVITILAVIALIVIPRITNSASTAKSNACYQNKAEINRAVEEYYFNTGSLPADISALSASFPEGVPTCPVSGAAYFLNATTKRVSGHTGSGKGGGH